MQSIPNIESFPIWDTTPAPRPRRTDWVTVGSSYDVALLIQLWSRVMQSRLWEIPDSDSIAWDLADVLLQGYRRDTVRVVDGMLQIDRRHLRELRDQADWLLDYITDEHGDHRYVWCRDVGDYVRVSDEQPVTDLDDARRVIPTIEGIREVAAENVIKFQKRV